MARIIVYKFPALTQEQLTELLALLAEAGLECDSELGLDKLEELLAAAAGDDDENDEKENRPPHEDPTEWVLIVILNPECDADGGLSEAARKISHAGGRVIGIWPLGAADGRVPPAVERYGADTIPWDVEQVRSAICGETVSWAEPTGAPRPEPPTRRHKC